MASATSIKKKYDNSIITALQQRLDALAAVSKSAQTEQARETARAREYQAELSSAKRAQLVALVADDLTD